VRHLILASRITTSATFHTQGYPKQTRHVRRASWLAQERASLGCTARALRPELLPPEVLAAAGGADEPATAGSIAAQDAWTLGVALHLMLTGDPRGRRQGT